MKSRIIILIAVCLALAGGYHNFSNKPQQASTSSEVFSPDAETREIAGVLHHLGREYRIEQGGAIQYLFRGDQQVSGGYHRHFLRDGEVWGQLGATEELVINRNGLASPLGGVTKDIHDEEARQVAVLRHLGESYRFESRGAIQYLVLNGERIDGGYHRHFLDNGKVWGQLGATKEVVVDTDGIIYTHGGASKPID